MTVSQLRSLRTFLQHLTKTELLKHTTERSKTNGTQGHLIPWMNLNMYDITSEVITKVIPHVDPKGEHIDETRRWYSWVEFVADEPQPAKIMFSHWWGGRFSDFMQAVDKMTLDQSLSIYTPIWVCTFAICQFGENFGNKLMDCPFIQTLKTVDLTVLIVDYQAGSLSRTWCGLEVHYTTQNEKEFMLYTSAGRVGSTFVSGGPLVEAVKEWDIRRSEASDPPYRRQILNYLAKVNELDGLKKTKGGEIALDKMGRPHLEDDRLDTSGGMTRLNGEPEFLHEAKLFQKHAKRFEQLNMMVRLRVMANLGLPRKVKGCREADPALRGLSLNQLRVVSAKLEASCPWRDDDEDCPWLDDELGEDVELEYNRLTTNQVSLWVQWRTMEESCSYMELVSDDPQKPQYALNLSETQNWSERMMAIELFAEAQQLPDSAVFFVDILSMNMNDREDAEEVFRSVKNECEGLIYLLSNEEDRDEDEVLDTLGPMIMEIGTNKGIFFASRHGVLACSQAFRSGTWVHGDFDVQVIYRLLALVLKNDDAENDAAEVDNENFRAVLRLHSWLAGPVLRRAARKDDAESVKRICSLPGLRLSSDTMKDHLGRMPLHIAVACKSVSALKALLEAKMDPNVEDDMKDRPLHYAAMAGQEDLAQILVAAGADPWGENCYTETALQVARQSPAAFLGVDTTKVVKFLSKKTQAIPWKDVMKTFHSFIRRPSAVGSAMSAARELSKVAA